MVYEVKYARERPDPGKQLPEDDAILLELKPNPDLIYKNFLGYKLSLDKIPDIKFTLPVKPHRLTPSDDQIAFIQFELVALQNHLVRDIWDTNTCYYCDADCNIQCVRYDKSTRLLEPLTLVYGLGKFQRTSQDYNIRFKFVSEKYCVLADGRGTLHLIDTGDRHNKTEWKSIFSIVALKKARTFYLQDAILEIENGKKIFYCVLMHVRNIGYLSYAVLSLIKLTEDESGSFVKFYIKEFVSQQLPTYCALEPKSIALMLCVNCYVYTNDAAHENIEPSNEDVEEPLLITWYQTDDEVFIKFHLDDQLERSSFEATTTDESIDVQHKGQSLLNGKLANTVRANSTYWYEEVDRETGAIYVSVSLVKTPQKRWMSVMEGKTYLEESYEEEVVPEPTDKEIEEIKKGIDERWKTRCKMGENYNLIRIDTKLFQITHKVNVGTNRPIFSHNQRPGSPPSIVLENQVDGLVWAPTLNIDHPNEWSLVHEGTVNALAYVQSSKMQRKFVQCSPNVKYTVICEPVNYIFMYDALTTGRRESYMIEQAKQKIFQFNDFLEIVGIAVEDDAIIVLSEGFIHVLQIHL